MKEFDYVRPSSLEEACALLASSEGLVKPLAGGTDLVVQMKQGKVRPQVLVSLRDVPGLSFISPRDDGGLLIGATTPLAAVENSAAVVESHAALAEAAAWIGSVQVRSRATVGGNLCNAAPSADLAPILIAYGAVAVITDGCSEREMALEDFFTGPGQTVLRPGELLKAVAVPPVPPRTFAKYLKAYRSTMDIATAGVALVMKFGESGCVCQDVKLVLGAVAPTPIRARETESMLLGQALTDDLIRAAGAKAAQEARPITDVRASAEYRRTLVEVFTRRALTAARTWVQEGEQG
ncbi:MAG: xanthine dehydrogenase family protein subunit M [Thermoleophilia bacterium]|nr:xanthine dehydrogenase family protein subunit M [Thermoleophilia bacterium]